MQVKHPFCLILYTLHSIRNPIDITDSFREYVHVIELEVLKQQMKVKVKKKHSKI
jgi:hypothetical protein